jgi:hypothetical protein
MTLKCTSNGWMLALRETRNKRTEEAAPAAIEPEYYLHPHLTTMPPPTNPIEGYTPVAAWSVTPGHINSSSPTTEKGTVGSSTNTADWAVPITGVGHIYARAAANASWNSFDPEGYKIVFNAGDLYPNQGQTESNETYWRLGEIVVSSPAGTSPKTYAVIPTNKTNLQCWCAGYVFFWQPFFYPD